MYFQEVGCELVLTMVIMRIIVTCDVKWCSLLDRVSACQVNLLPSLG